LDWKKIFPKSVNLMIVDKKNVIFSWERWVLNWLNFSLTGACGTGTVSVWYFLWDWNYVSAGWYEISTERIGKNKILLKSSKKNLIIKNRF
jgi:hypothetical protein